MNFTLLSSFVVGCIYFKNMHCINNKKKAYIVDQKELIGGQIWILRLSVIECRFIQIKSPLQVVFK
jgi:hypothetical protein